MEEIYINDWDRKRTYNWFKTFSNSIYSCNVVMDVTKPVRRIFVDGYPLSKAFNIIQYLLDNVDEILK